MCNFRENYKESSIEEDCVSCVHFTSYKDIYEDELEPYEYGTCPNVDDMVGESYICDKFEKVIQNGKSI